MALLNRELKAYPPYSTCQLLTMVLLLCCKYPVETFSEVFNHFNKHPATVIVMHYWQLEFLGIHFSLKPISVIFHC
jgi:hypothetical protein